MTPRTFLNPALVAILIGVNVHLLLNEQVEQSAEKLRRENKPKDPLLDLRYTPSDRKANFKAFGMPDEMVAKTVSQTRFFEDKYKRKITLMLRDAAEPTAVADALCGQTNQVRPRYGALRFLVVEDKGLRHAIDLQRVSRLEKQEWAVRSPIDAVYSKIELASERQDDATLMAIAAIMSGREEDVQQGHAPWGSGLVPGSWSWKRVKKEEPGIEKRLVDYFALMELFVEIATGDEGICGT